MSSFTNQAGGEVSIKVIANDGTERSVLRGVLEQSTYAKGYLGVNTDEPELLLATINGPVMQQILNYLEHYRTEPMKALEKPLASNNIAELLQQPFYSDFIDQFNQEQLLEVTRGANFMGIAPLMDLCCAKIASFIRNKTPAEIRTNLNLSTNFTKAQEDKVKEENKWAETL